jgi:hypothetical protein
LRSILKITRDERKNEKSNSFFFLQLKPKAMAQKSSSINCVFV